MNLLGAFAVVALGVAMTAAGVAAWSGSWNFWATPGIPGYGVLPLLFLPAGIMLVSAGIVTPFGDLAENPLAALVLLPVIVGFFGGAIITIPGFILLFLWSPKHVPDLLRPRWLPPTWTPPDQSFSTFSRPFLRRELRDRRPPGPHWPARLVELTGPPNSSPPRYGILAINGAAITWFDCPWNTVDCKEAFTLSAPELSEFDIRQRPAHRFLQAPLTLSVAGGSSRFVVDVFCGVLSSAARLAASTLAQPIDRPEGPETPD